MPVITILRHGCTSGTPPGKNTHMRAPRGKVGGWSQGATRRNIAFLRSVDERTLSGSGYAATLTPRDCPPTPDEWHKLRRRWVERMRRAGLLRLHWVTEWQRRGVPHLHVALWMGEPTTAALINPVLRCPLRAWLAVAADYGAEPWGQHVTPITDAVGWFQYVAKHAARGVRHYQRSTENIPREWQEKTGRVWGRVGDWVTVDSMRVELQDNRDSGDGGYFAFRRLARAWRTADARAVGDWRRLVYARRALRCSDPAVSRIRGVSEWIPQDLLLTMLDSLAGRGFSIRG